MSSPGARPFEVELHLQVKSYDIDVAGIVSNIVFVRWLEDLRLAILSTYFPLEKQLAAGFAPVISQTRIEYKKPLKMFDRPVARMWVSEMSSVKWVVAAEISLDGNIVAIAEQTGFFANLSSGRPIPIPDELARRYSEYQQSSVNVTREDLR